MWNWCRQFFVNIVIFISFIVCCLHADDTVQKLPFCNPTNPKDGPIHKDLMIVSTLDGKLTAFSTQNGLKVWAMDTQPLVSSSIHHVELSSGGKWVRLVPSLRGTLYSLSGDNIEPLPFDADTLLSASYKYSDDLVIAGAKETVWFGVDANTGGVLYECGSSGCSTEQAATSARDILVLRRRSNTVRALDPRLGNEKWNFSVAEHELALSRRECVGGAAPGASPPVYVSVALHDGTLALKAPGTAQTIWQQQLEAPLAGMWRFSAGTLQTIDVLWETSQTLTAGSVSQQPSLYIGVHERQLYIQESPLYSPKLDTAVATQPWKLVSAKPRPESETALQPTEPDHTLSEVTLYGPSGPVGDYGFFLYLQETCDQAVQTVPEDAIDSTESNNSEESMEHHHIHVHVYSLWYWWKEVLVIAVSSALLMNFMIWPRFSTSKRHPSSPLPTNQQYIIMERHYERPPALPEYVSRYEADFTPLRLLGKGGFGVVFEASNNIDHCSYAVKRITLPKKEEKRERVLREVRALAKLEHEHIVRYFNAWVEQPPPMWQQQRDAVWMRNLDVSLAMSDEYSVESPAPPLPIKQALNDSVMLNLQRPLDECIDALDFDKRLQEPSKRFRSQSCSDSFSIVFDEGAPKHVTSSKEPSNHSVHTDDVTSTPSKNIPTDDDSFVVFANSDPNSSGHNDLTRSLGHNSPGQSPSRNGLSQSPNHNPDLSPSRNGLSQSPSRNGLGQSPVHSEGYISSGYSEARNHSVDKRLERVKECDYKTDTTTAKKKKGHTRHWSLDMVVKADTTKPNSSPVQMYLYIQMQLCKRDSLHDWLRHNRTVEQRGDMIKTLFSQIVSAVEYVHLAGLIHRDLKPSNILFALDGRVKVGDFGLVTAMGDTASDDGERREVDLYHKHTEKVGTHLYMSPEQMQGRPYSYKVDIYSLGMILFELLQPFGTEAERVDCLTQVRRDRYPQLFHQQYPNETNVLKLMLSEDPSRRPTASGVKARAPLYELSDEKYHFTLPAFAALTC